MPDEEMVYDPETGARKARKLARYDLLPAGPLRQLAEHYGRNCRKYEDRNWEAGYAWSLNFGAMMRHAWAWWGGEEMDPDSATDDDPGSHHLAAVAWHALALLEFLSTHPEKDDRPATRERQKSRDLLATTLKKALDAERPRTVPDVAGRDIGARRDSLLDERYGARSEVLERPLNGSFMGLPKEPSEHSSLGDGRVTTRQEKSN